MSIINQNLSVSEKKKLQSFVLGAFATGVTNLLGLIPYNCLLQGVNFGAFGISNSPVYSLSVFRATSGGLTSVPLGVSFASQAFGTSGPIGASIAGAGVTLLAGDALVVVSAGTNAAIESGLLNIVYSALADIKSYQNTVS